MSSSLPPSPEPAHRFGHDLPPRGAAPEDLLPPVEPPSAGFILQLFVIPALIVAAVVGVWFVIESMAQRGEQDPQAIVAVLGGSSQAKFQQAKELADMLRMPERYPKLKGDHQLAAGLAELLDAQVAAGDDSEGAVTMRMFLATALGEFQVDDGAAVLLKTALADPQRDVRRKAINSLAVLAGSLAALDPPQRLGGDEEIVAGLDKLAEEQDELIRSETAFTIGMVAAADKAPDARLVDALARLADDPYTDARFNAALGLARVGDPRAAAALAEMFDLDSLAASLAGEKALTAEVTDAALVQQKAFKRNLILGNALTGVDEVAKNPSTPAEAKQKLAAAMKTFLSKAPSVTEPAPIPGEVLDGVRRGLEKLRATGT